MYKGRCRKACRNRDHIFCVHYKSGASIKTMRELCGGTSNKFKETESSALLFIDDIVYGRGHENE